MNEVMHTRVQEPTDLAAIRIGDYLEHGSRFRFIERVTHFRPYAAIECAYHFTGEEPYMQDHIPNRPLMAGVLLLEGMMQAAALLYMLSTQTRKRRVIARSADGIVWHLPVQPPKQLNYHVLAIEQGDDQWAFSGRVFYAKRLMAECRRFVGAVPR